MAYPQLAVGQAASDLRYRFQWNAPIRLSPHDPDVLYHASQFVHRSTDQGQSWQEISPDLSRNDPKSRLRRRPDHLGQHRRRGLRHRLRVRGVAARARAALGRHRRRPGAPLARQRRELERDHPPSDMPEWGQVNMIELSAHAGRPRLSGGHPLPHRRLHGPTSSAPTTSAPAGRCSPTAATASRRTTSCASCVRTRSARACSTPAPSSAFMSRSTTAPAGSRCSSTCPFRRSPTWRSSTATWWWPPRAGPSGSWTTSARYASFRPECRRAPRISSSHGPRTASAAVAAAAGPPARTHRRAR